MSARALSSDAGDAGLPLSDSVLGTRRVYILPSRQGIAFAALLLVMLVGAINYNNSLAYLLTFLLSSAALVAMLHTWRNLYGLRVTAAAGRPVFAGGHAELRLALDNPDSSPRPAIAAWLAGDERTTAVRTVVPAEGSAWLTLSRAARRRGRLDMGRLVIASRYPVGLFRAWAVLETGVECIVYPEPGGQRQLPPPVAGSARASGRTARGEDDFAGFRTYHPGDSLRHVHWKAVARERGVMVKQFEGAAAEDLLLRLADTPGRDLEERLSQVCRWVLEAEAAGMRYGLELPEAQLAPGRGEAHRERCLRVLALHGTDLAGRPRPRGRPARLTAWLRKVLGDGKWTAPS